MSLQKNIMKWFVWSWNLIYISTDTFEVVKRCLGSFANKFPTILMEGEYNDNAKVICK